ncbi:antibiotic biosynthesis monooxygenase [Sporosarcina gallistercoris]|uniref:antibiotic biosynthesis monooxygenase n=1 Tax=Sporosarcina gallistercoris TaxID=2762245 RepID=UPI003D266AFE
MSQMTAVNVIRVEKGRAQEVADRFAKPKSVHTFPGFLRMEVWMKENLEDHDELHICTTWEHEKYFKEWLKSRENDKSHGESTQKQGTTGESEANMILGAELSTYVTLVQHLPALNV